MDVKDMMIEAYERGDCSYEGAYEHVRESLADRADSERKARKEGMSAQHEDAYWLGRFSMRVAFATAHLKDAKGHDVEIALTGLRDVLEDFLASPCRHPGLKGELRKARRGV